MVTTTDMTKPDVPQPVGITPMPPRGRSVLPWDEEVDRPVDAIAEDRADVGDTFAVASGGQTYLFVFSPTGVRSFYDLPERDASKGIADWRMLRRKIPDELFDGRRTLPGELFGRNATSEYLENVHVALVDQCAELGNDGVIDLFVLSRRLGHRLGLGSWGPPGALGDRFGELISALDALDASAAFVTPGAMLAARANDRSAERLALASAEAILVALIADESGERSDAHAAIAMRWADEPADVRHVGIARDVILIHLGSMSNLFAAIGWTLVDLLAHPEHLAEVRVGDPLLAERCCLESIRLAQRSIMMREVLRPIAFDAGSGTYHVEPGVTIATLLPLTNASATAGLEEFDPDRWARRRLADVSQLGARELVTTFGHGEHTCPAQPYSLATMTRAVHHLVTMYDFAPRYRTVAPLAGQIGGVARSHDPCTVDNRRRNDPDPAEDPIR
jgi:cytochrome P450